MTDKTREAVRQELYTMAEDAGYGKEPFEHVVSAILAIPRIAAALKALEREEAMARKLGHSVGRNG